MTANGVYSVLNVPWKATAFLLWRAIESRWNKNMDSRLLRNSSGSSTDLLDQLNGQVVPCSGSLDCHWKEDVGYYYYFRYYCYQQTKQTDIQNKGEVADLMFV